METKEVKNCSKANSKDKISVLSCILSGFTILIGILEVLDTPSEVLVPIAVFWAFISMMSFFLLFNKEKNK